MLLKQVSSRVPVACRSRQHRAIVVRAQITSNSETSAVGEKVEKWLKTPFDIAAFGPRVGVGALVSLPDRLQTLQADVERVVELLQDPRPLPEKQDAVLKEVEDTLLQFLEKGVTVESDALANLKTILPPDAVSILNELIPEPPNKEVYVPEEVVDVQPAVTYYQADVQANQLASEMTEIKNAVAGLKSALDAVRTNSNVSQTNMLRLTLRESRDLLSKRLQEVSATTFSDPAVSAATREARILLEEVDAQFF